MSPERGESFGESVFKFCFISHYLTLIFFFCYKINFPQEESVSPVTVTGDLSLSSSQSEPFLFSLSSSDEEGSEKAALVGGYSKEQLTSALQDLDKNVYCL